MTFWNDGSDCVPDHNISLYYTENPEQFIKLNYYTNIKPITIEENNKKGIKIYD